MYFRRPRFNLKGEYYLVEDTIRAYFVEQLLSKQFRVRFMHFRNTIIIIFFFVENYSK